jgi:hypothetical protein
MTTGSQNNQNNHEQRHDKERKRHQQISSISWVTRGWEVEIGR